MANIWGNSGNSGRLYFLGSKINADGYCSHEIKRCLLLGRKVMIKLESILKSRDITLLTKVCLVKAMIFSVAIYGYESWTTKKAEHWRTNAFELSCWLRLLRVPWTAWDQTSQSKRKSVLNIHWKDWCWSWNSNILATLCEELTHWKRPWWTGKPLQSMGSQRVRHDWEIELTLNHPLPTMTSRQLRGFLGITGYCCIWILGYGELAQP